MGTPVSLDDGGSIILTFDMEISSGAGGTGFDLQDLILAGGPQVKTGAVDLAHIVIIRIVDVIGDIANGGATTDHLGRAVADPYPTAGDSSGVDITGAAVINTGAVTVEERSWGELKSLFR
jgi:hypothetical protein